MSLLSIIISEQYDFVKEIVFPFNFTPYLLKW